MQRLEGRCPRCTTWFWIEDPNLDTHYLCPACLSVADRTRWADVPRDESTAHGGAA